VRRQWIGIAIITAAVAAGGWMAWMHTQSRLRSRYVHPIYSAGQILLLNLLARQPSFSPSSVMRFIQSAESNRCRLRTLHVRVTTCQVFYPAYVNYVQGRRAVLRTLEKGEAPSGEMRTDATRIGKPLVDQSSAEWWMDVEKGWIRVKRYEASYQAELANSAFGDVVEAGCGAERLIKVYGTGYLGYAHRVVVAPPTKEAIEVLFLECDSDWLLLLTIHYQAPRAVPGKQSSFWEYVFGDCHHVGKRFATWLQSTVRGTGVTPWGERCHVVSVEPKGTLPGERLWLWFSIPKDFVCVRAAWEYGDRIQVWSADKWQRVNGVWFPTSGRLEEYFSLAKASGAHASSGYILARKASFTLEPLAINTLLPGELFTVPFPASAWVDDHFRHQLYPYGRPVATKRPQRVLAVGVLGIVAILSYVAWKVYHRR